MQFPTGLSDFGLLIQGGRWYQDRTDIFLRHDHPPAHWH